MSLLRFLHILAVALALSAYAAWLRSERTSSPDRSADQTVVGIPLLHRSEAEALWHDSGTIFLDVRPRTDYSYGHIAGALSFPEDEPFEEHFPALRSRLEKARTIVVYCKSVDCARSLWMALRLRDAGLTQTCIYPHGWNDWSEHDLPVTRTATR